MPMVDIFVRTDGLKAEDGVRLVTEPLETIVKAINGVEHVYSNTLDDRVLVTARFLVGTKSDDAILRVHEKIRANIDRIPTGIPEPLIVGRGIDDVAIVTLTLAPKPEAAARYQDNALYHLAENLLIELAKLEDVGLSYIVGGRPDQIRVEPDPERLSLYGVTLAQLIGKVRDANRSFQAGRIRDRNQSIAVTAGQTLRGVPDIGLLLITTRDGRPVYVRDVANVVVGAKPLERQAWHFRKTADGSSGARAGRHDRARQAGRRQRRRHRRAHPPSARRARQASWCPTTSRSSSRATTARPPTRRPTSCCSISAWPPSPSCC